MEVFTNGREWHFLHINARRYFLFFFSSRAVELDLTNREEVLEAAHYGRLKPLSLHIFDAGGVGGPPSLLAIAFSFSIVK